LARRCFDDRGPNPLHHLREASRWDQRTADYGLVGGWSANDLYARQQVDAGVGKQRLAPRIVIPAEIQIGKRCGIELPTKKADEIRRLLFRLNPRSV
jgi:hypothetical protein